jgi:hypothetical protein
MYEIGINGTDKKTLKPMSNSYIREDGTFYIYRALYSGNPPSSSAFSKLAADKGLRRAGTYSCSPGGEPSNPLLLIA